MQTLPKTVRLPLLTDQTSYPQDTITNGLPVVWNGTNLRFELGLFYNDTLLDVSNIDSITFEIKDSNSRTGLPYIARTISSADLDVTVTQETWDDGTAQHAAIEFDHSETILALTGNSTNFWMVISAIVNDGDTTKNVVLGAGTITVLESGYLSEAPSSVVQTSYYTRDQCDARFLATFPITEITNMAASANTNALAAVNTATEALAEAELMMPLAGGTFTGAVNFSTGKFLTLGASPTAPYHAATKEYVDTAVLGGLYGIYVPLNGSQQMTGDLLLLAADPAADDSAVRRKYLIDNFINIDGETAFTGHVNLPDIYPQEDLDAAPKGYVDDQIEGVTGTSPTLYTLEMLSDAINNDSAYYSTVTAALALKLSLTGGTMTGLLYLDDAVPTGYAAVSKTYADSYYYPITAGTALTGLVSFSGASGLLKLPCYTSGATGWNASGANAGQPTSAAAGYLIYNSISNTVQYHNGTAFVSLTSSSSGTPWSSNSGLPTGGSNGDYYLDTDDGSIYSKIAGTWTALYTPTAASGSSWSSGSGVPDDETGSNGNWYVNTSGGEGAGDIYEKNSGHWYRRVSPAAAGSMGTGGGTFTGGITFAIGVAPAITFLANEGGDWGITVTGATNSGFKIGETGMPPILALDTDGNVDLIAGARLNIGSDRVLTSQQAAIDHLLVADSLETTISTVNSILTAMEAHGLIAAS